MGGKPLPDLIYCACCSVPLKPRAITSKYCSVKCQNVGRRTKRLTEPPEKKICSRCRKTKPASEFHRCTSSPILLQAQCKQCLKERSRKKEYYYYQCEICGMSVRRIKKSPALEKTRTIRCRSCTRQQRLDKNGGHSWNYKGKKDFAGRMMPGWKGSAKKRGHAWHLTKTQLDKLFVEQKGICALSGVRMIHERRSPYRPSLDRINSKIGYVEGNVQFVCSIVNVMKNKFSEDMFIEMCKHIVKHALIRFNTAESDSEPIDMPPSFHD